MKGTGGDISTDSPHLQSVKPDVLISIHGLAPSFSPQFLNPEKRLYGEDNHVHSSRGSATKYRTLFYHATT